MAIITKIDGGKQAITFNNDTEPVAVYVDGQLQESISFVPKSATGTNSVSYTSEYKKNLLELDIEGNTEQKQLQGKNLFDMSKNRYSGVSTIVAKTQNSITVSGNGSWQSVNIEIPNGKDLIGKTITISGNISKSENAPTQAGLYVRWFDGYLGVGVNAKNIGVAGANAVGYVSKSGVVQDLDFETYPNAKLCVAFYSNIEGTNDPSASITYSNVQVEFGSTPTEYEEYCGGIPSPNPQYPQEIQNADNMSVELSGDFEPKTVQIPTHLASQDKLLVNYIDKSVNVNKSSVIYEFTGSESFTDISYGGDYAYTCTNFAHPVISDNYYCTHFQKFNEKNPAFDIMSSGGTGADVSFYYVSQTTVDDFKSWLAEQYANGTPVKIQYITSDNANTNYTGETWANELINLPTQNATNIITVNSSIPTSRLDVNFAEWGGKDESIS